MFGKNFCLTKIHPIGKLGPMLQEAGVKECWRLGMSDEAGQLLRHLTDSCKNWSPAQSKKKRSHAAMIGLHGLPELALAMCAFAAISRSQMMSAAT